MDSLQEFIQIEKSRIPERVLQATIVETPRGEEQRRPIAPIVFTAALQADEFIPWGTNIRGRDLQLRTFYGTEPLLSSAVYIGAARMSAIPYEVVNSDPTEPRQKNTIRAAERLFRTADRGRGWLSYLIKTVVDLYTTDNGAFTEVIREDNRPDSPIVGIAHLDSWRCERTGDPEKPVLYSDDKGRRHLLDWWNVIPLSEFPSPVETMFDAQACAVTRCLIAAQTIRDIMLYKKEKVSGNFARSLHFIGGVTRDNIDDALAIHAERVLSQNLMRYQQPPMIPTLDPEATLSHIQIDLASLPDAFDEDTTMRWYVTVVANAFGVDYQELAPLTGGSLGSGQQSEILHLKSRGKGPALLISLFENMFNDWGILPSTVKFQFTVTDPGADRDRAEARFNRGKDRQLRIASGELDIPAARKLAREDGDLPEHLLEEMEKRPLPQMQQNPLTGLSNQQVQGGIDTRQGDKPGSMTKARKSFPHDDVRAEVIRALIERGDLKDDDAAVSKQRALDALTP